MKILFIKLINFIGVYASRGLKEVSYDFSKIDKPIIQLYGPNRCGKTVLIQQLHPFSSVNLSGDDRSDLSLIMPCEMGLKNIVYEFNGSVYDITHTYKPNSHGTNHTVSSSIKKDGEELNPSGGVNQFNTIINNIFGINKYTFQFIINGTQLGSFASMSTVQRKNLLNKAMGIDIYDKIHKMSTDDYRYTNKLITSLNNTKEYILSTYGSYEDLVTTLEMNKAKHDQMLKELNDKKSRMDALEGQISLLKKENIGSELTETQNLINIFDSVRAEMGDIDDSTYERLVDEQIKLNADISEMKNKRLMLLQDIDNLHAKKEDIENTLRNNQRLREDYDNMLSMQEDIKRQINNLAIDMTPSSPSSYYTSMISVARLINGICKEIGLSINSKHLQTLNDMIQKDIDVSAFIVQEGSLLMDSEKEKSVISKIQSMLNTIDGDWVDECPKLETCVYHKAYDTLTKYFKASQSTDSSKFTQYDMEQFDHAFKNVLSIKRILSQQTLDEDIQYIFNIKTIMNNVNEGNFGIDMKPLQHLMENAINIETRNRLITQLTDIEKRLSVMKDVVMTSTDVNSTLREIGEKINNKNGEVQRIKENLDRLTNDLSINDRKRMLLSQIKHVKYSDLQVKLNKYLSKSSMLSNAENEYNTLSQEYNMLSIDFSVIERNLKGFTDDYNQYNKTVGEITKFSDDDATYRIIAEATSSTKGKPVYAIRDEIEKALMLTNRLLDVMYDGDIEMLTPVIDENNFALPFRSGDHSAPDIKHGSQSESCLLSIALSLSLGSSLTVDMVPLLDEVDAFIDHHMKDSFVLMIQEIMSTLNIEQTFIISHNITPGQYDHIMHVMDITEEESN